MPTFLRLFRVLRRAANLVWLPACALALQPMASAGALQVVSVAVPYCAATAGTTDSHAHRAPRHAPLVLHLVLAQAGNTTHADTMAPPPSNRQPGRVAVVAQPLPAAPFSGAIQRVMRLRPPAQAPPFLA